MTEQQRDDQPDAHVSTTAADDISAATDAPEAVVPERDHREGVDPDDSGVLIGELGTVDPRHLVLGTNIRTDARLAQNFVRSIRDRGVREPITVRRRDDGAFVVRKGTRRTLAAIEAGLTLVPILIETGTDPAETDTIGQVERLVDQIEENDQRLANTDTEQVGAVQQLLELGLSAAAIAKRTHRPRKRVQAEANVARSQLVAKAMARYDSLTLDRAAAIAEFDDASDKGTEAIKALIVTAEKEPRQFDHVLQRLRDEREHRRMVAARVAELEAARVRVIGDGDDLATSPRISGLRPSAADPTGTELTEEAHRDCPGHAALVTVQRRWSDQPDVVVTHWLCTDPDAGHAARFDTSTATATAGATGLPKPHRMSEEEKAERRRVVANNKAWDSAATVRRRWLTETFLPRRTPPKNAQQHIAEVLGRGGHHLRRAMESGYTIAHELLGVAKTVETRIGSPVAAEAATATPARATMLTLGLLLGAVEQSIGRHTWRNPDNEAIAYFSALQRWGYELSPVERLVLDPDGGSDTRSRSADDPVAESPAPDRIALDAVSTGGQEPADADEAAPVKGDHVNAPDVARLDAEATGRHHGAEGATDAHASGEDEPADAHGLGPDPTAA